MCRKDKGGTLLLSLFLGWNDRFFRGEVLISVTLLQVLPGGRTFDKLQTMYGGYRKPGVCGSIWHVQGSYLGEF